MDKNKLLDAMTHMDPVLIESADAAPARRKCWPRPALIAACLCLVLAGTAAALKASREFQAAKPVRGVYVDEFSIQDNHALYQISGGFTYIPMDMVSDNIWELLGQEKWGTPVVKGFDSWTQAEKFVGLKFADNRVLEKAIKAESTHQFGPGRPKTATGNCILSVIGSLKAPTFLELSASYCVDSTGKYEEEIQRREYRNGEGSAWYLPEAYTRVKVNAIIATESAYYDSGGESFIIRDGDYFEQYTTAGGGVAYLREAAFAGGEKFPGHYYGTFSLNGVRIRIHSVNERDPDAALETLKQVLDGFE